MIHLYYRYCELDKTHDYSVISTEEINYWYCWVWFYLGNFMEGKQYYCRKRLYPYKVYGHKLLKKYKTSRNAEEMAELIFNAIKKHRV